MKSNQPSGSFLRGLLTLCLALPWTFIIGLVVIVASSISQATVFRLIQLWARGLLYIARVKIELDNLSVFNQLERVIFLSNHKSAIDVPILLSIIPWSLKPVFLAKSTLFNVPFFGFIIQSANYVAITRQNHKNDIAAIQSVLKTTNYSIVAFPEGERVSGKNMGSFKIGLFGPLQDSQLPICPISIHNSEKALPRHSWLVRPSVVRVIVGCTLLPQSRADAQNRMKLAELVRRAILSTFPRNQEPDANQKPSKHSKQS